MANVKWKIAAFKNTNNYTAFSYKSWWEVQNEAQGKKKNPAFILPVEHLCGAQKLRMRERGGKHKKKKKADVGMEKEVADSLRSPG